jgi:hypothetical protein
VIAGSAITEHTMHLLGCSYPVVDGETSGGAHVEWWYAVYVAPVRSTARVIVGTPSRETSHTWLTASG